MNVRRIVAGFLAGLALVSGRVDAQSTSKSMTVFVTAADVVEVKKVDKDTETRLRAALKDTETKRKDLEKELRAKHGKKPEDWPADAMAAYADAEEAAALASADYWYRTVKPAGLSDSVEDIKRAVAGEGLAGQKSGVTIVQTRDEAQLIIEVNGRRSGKSGLQGGMIGLKDDQYWISFLLKPGPKLSNDRFDAVPRDYRLSSRRYSVVRLAAPRPDSRQWRFEAYNTQRWSMVANAVSILIEDFIAKNYDAMMTSK